MASTTEITASPRLRARLAIAAAIMLGLWAWSFASPVENWGNPNEDGFSYVALFYATIFCLPPGLFLLVGAIAGHGRYVRRARIAFVIASIITFVVVTFLIIQHIADNNDGKVFGIQIGSRDTSERCPYCSVRTFRSALMVRPAQAGAGVASGLPFSTT